jgi:WD40 repeat protein
LLCSTTSHDTHMCTPNQVAKDNQLLYIATDYLQFATSFFQVIDVSATHIYHSALEQSPLSSIVRKLYYSQRPCPLPRVVAGIPDMWDPSTTSFSTDDYISSTWSPCGQFVAAVALEALEIWDASTLKLLSTIQSTKVATKFRPGLAYSPDGHSLASCSDIGIVIWDTQTGGVVKIITCKVTYDGLELVWSLNGMTIGTISPWVTGTCTVRTYKVASGIIQSSGALQSSEVVQSTDSKHFWAHDKSFRVVVGMEGQLPIGVFEVGSTGSTLTQVEQFHAWPYSYLGAFSPITYRISALSYVGSSTDYVLFILDVHTSKVLLQETGYYSKHAFSPDGTFFMAFAVGQLLIWRYTSGCYTLWREFQESSAQLQFSPSSSSILSCTRTLCIYRLDSPASLPKGSVIETCSQLQDTFSPDHTYIVTAYHKGSTVTITNLNSQHLSPSQFIDTDLEISTIILTGNILLVKGPDTVVAWLLTEEGVVDGTFGNTRAGRKNSLWMIVTPPPTLLAQPQQSQDNGGNPGSVPGFLVEGKIAAIIHNGCVIHVYHMGTGEILGLDKAPQYFGYHLTDLSQGYCEPFNLRQLRHGGHLRCDWPVSRTTLRDGWVKDTEGKHRLWLHACWRKPKSIDWLHPGTALRLKISSELVVIRF